MLDVTLLAKDGHPQTDRTLYIIDPQKKLKCVMGYPSSTGRNLQEVVRVIDSLLVHSQSGLITSANWQPGQDLVIDPRLSDEKYSPPCVARF
jgi:peroxiredoxin (alkyl hydroperoxide reductase subunit C)